MATLSFKNVTKVFDKGREPAVKDFNLEIEDKEFVVLVGPSGCGKSTTLRMVAGLEDITSGEIYIDGQLINNVPPKKRDIAMVFQNYALYPHMTVYKNMAFGLKLRRMPKADIDRRVRETAKLLGIDDRLDRKPGQLSGGQRQRVALGRAIVREPRVFLMDEPLSNLDAKLRVQMRSEITRLHNRLDATFIYVTHDQTEAMTMGTRIVVMKDGVIQQAAPPQELYDHPANLFVAGFIGTPAMNVFKVKLTPKNNAIYAMFGENEIRVPDLKVRDMKGDFIGREVYMGIRPEDITDEDPAENASIKARVEITELMGSETNLYLSTSGHDDNVIARVSSRSKIKAGDDVIVGFDTSRLYFFDAATEKSIL